MKNIYSTKSGNLKLDLSQMAPVKYMLFYQLVVLLWRKSNR